jgi:hypothetical protein
VVADPDRIEAQAIELDGGSARFFPGALDLGQGDSEMDRLAHGTSFRWLLFLYYIT